MDQHGLIQAVDRFREGVAVRVTNAADRWLYPGLDQTLGVSNGQILPAAIAMMYQPALLNGRR